MSRRATYQSAWRTCKACDGRGGIDGVRCELCEGAGQLPPTHPADPRCSTAAAMSTRRQIADAGESGDG